MTSYELFEYLENNFINENVSKLDEIKEKVITPLEARYDSRASFCNKAKVVEFKIEKYIIKMLISYDTIVAINVEPCNEILVGGYYSQTTTRHIKEFYLYCYPFANTLTTKDIKNMVLKWRWTDEPLPF